MDKYILDNLKEILTEKEAQKYYSKTIGEMNILERKSYLKNERNYLYFFKSLFKRNRKVILNLKRFSSYDIEKLFKNERKIFRKNLKEIENFKFKKKNMLVYSFKILKMILKLSYRDVFGFQGVYRFYFPKDKIYICSLTDYYYLIIFFNKDKKTEKEIKKIIDKSNLCIKKI